MDSLTPPVYRPLASKSLPAIFDQFAMGDFHGDAVPDVFSLKRTNTGTGGFEVYVLNAIMERVAEAEPGLR